MLMLMMREFGNGVKMGSSWGIVGIKVGRGGFVFLGGGGVGGVGRRGVLLGCGLRALGSFYLSGRRPCTLRSSKSRGSPIPGQATHSQRPGAQDPIALRSRPGFLAVLSTWHGLHLESLSMCQVTRIGGSQGMRCSFTSTRSSGGACIRCQTFPVM
jgi:hypothetical protein